MNNTIQRILWVGAAIALLGTGAYAQGGRPYIGVVLDPNPLSDLLTKHLRLAPGQGVRIQNVVTGSPADEAGLEPDDIVVAVQGQDVSSSGMLAQAIADEQIGATIEMEIIHLGQRKTLELKLAAASPHSQLKYPSEAGMATTWQPGRVWQWGPGGWTSVPFQSVPQVNPDVSKLFQGHYTYYGGTWPDLFTITVEGDPNDADSRVVVQARDGEHAATVGTIEALPEKYRAAAGEALKGAIQAQTGRQRPSAWGPPWSQPPAPDQFNQYFQNPNPWYGYTNPNQTQEGQRPTLEGLQEQLERLRQRMDQLEQRYDSSDGHEPPDMAPAD